MRILIADDHAIVRQGLKSLIEKQSDMQVVGEAGNGAQILRLVEELDPDVVIMDISMPDMNGIEAAGLILEKNPDVKIIALSMHSSRKFVVEMLKAGALGYVLKSYFFDDLVKAIHAVTAGQHYLSSQITDVIVGDYAGRKPTDENGTLEILTKSQRDIVRFVAEGLTTKQIALKIHKSPKTIDAGRRRIMDTIGVDSVAELTKYAIREGLTNLET
jgi:DNA-binding NarL/FixJ family response regulator